MMVGKQKNGSVLLRKGKLNLSQAEIVRTEQIYPKRIQNIISFKLHLPDSTPQMVKSAVDTVLDSADVFAAVLRCNKHGWFLNYGSRKVSECNILKRQSVDWAEGYMNLSDRLPFDMERQLYQASIIPLSNGGVFLYVRFHRIIIDSYGMYVFVQRVFDVLAKKKICQSVFATDNACPEMETTDGFWSSYFSDTEFETSVFPQKAAEAKSGRYTVSVPDALMEAVESFGEQEHIPVPCIVAAAYAYYLSQAADRKDAVFLMPHFNRNSGQMNTIGCYALLVPIRVTILQTDTFRELCRKVKQAAQEAAIHMETGFRHILSELHKENRIENSFSGYVFSFHQFQYDTRFHYSLRFHMAGEVWNDMSFHAFYDEKMEMKLQFEYREGVYTKEKAVYFSNALFAILARGVQNKKLSHIQIVGKAEYEKVTSFFGKKLAADREWTIPSLFAYAVKQYGKKPAVYAGGRTLTFEELDNLSDKVARGLRCRGVKSGDCAAFLLNRDYRLIPAILGIAKTGAAFLPIDPTYSVEQISCIMGDSQAVCLISSANVAISRNYDYVEMDELLSQIEEPELLPEPEPEQCACIIYTPKLAERCKGVMFSHKGLVTMAHPDNNPFNRDITRNCHGTVAIGSVGSAAFLFEIFSSLMNGLFVELGNGRVGKDARELATHILRHKADILHCSPSRIMECLKNRVFSKAFCNIRAYFAAGEDLTESFVRDVKNVYNIRIYNGYGPKGTVMGAAMTEADDGLTLGGPIANTGVLLLNRNCKLVPFGAVGEICVYGDGAAIGYKNKLEGTVLNDILWNGIRLCRTGDFGYFSEDGRLICYRKKEQSIPKKVQIAKNIYFPTATFDKISDKINFIK